MEALAVVKEVATILLVVSASALCIFVIVGLVRLFPYLLHLVENLTGTTASTAKIAGDLAVVSADVAADVRKTTVAAAEASENLASTTASTAKIAGDLANVSSDVATDVRKTAAGTAEVSENLASTTASTAKIAGDLEEVSSDVATDVKKTTAAVAEASENLVKGSKNILESSAYIRTALQLLELLGPAGRAANYANMGISKIPDLLRRVFRRG